jgi:glycosyltransferase involved in cell wall biosynthesis
VSVAPRVSLVASTYRSERFLPAWLDSLEALTLWPNAELVVVANDPQPTERELLETFKGRNPQVKLLVVARETLYRSWNRAIAASSATLLGIANVDDLRTPSSLEQQIKALEADPGALFCYGPFANSNEFPPNEAASTLVPSQPFDRELFTRGMMLGPFFVWRRSTDPATSFFDEQLRVGGDMDLAIRLAIHGKGVRVDKNLGFYFNEGTGLSTGGDAQPIERTVLELRYGIYDKIDYRFVPQAAEFVIPRILQPDGSWLGLSSVIPDYERFLSDRRQRWADKGLMDWSRSFARSRRPMRRIRRRMLSAASGFKRIVRRRLPQRFRQPT